jgi:hypothetical protein
MRSFHHYVTDLEHCLFLDASAPRLVGTVKLFGNFFPWQVFYGHCSNAVRLFIFDDAASCDIFPIGIISNSNIFHIP